MKNKINSYSLILFLIIGVGIGLIIKINIQQLNSDSQQSDLHYSESHYSDSPHRPYINPYIPRGIPINIPTNIGFIPQATYMQIGILSPLNNKNENKILPLMGRPLFANRDKWQYYSMSDQNNSIRLPIIKNGKNCTNEYGCNIFSDGDRVYVEGYNQVFKVTLYQNNTMRYIPVL